MQIRIFTIPLGAEVSLVEELNHFLRANKVIDVKRELATDVHIIGFGMDFSEIDIWWLLAKRTRLMRVTSKNFKGKDLIRNRIFYYGHNGEDKHKIELLEAYGVKCIIKDKPEGENWKGLYDQLINEMKINMDTRKNH